MCRTPSPMIMETLEFLRKSVNTEVAVREFAACARMRQGKNGYSHPFSSIASKPVRESAMALYSSLLSSDYTKVYSVDLFELIMLCSIENIFSAKIN